MTDFAGFGLPPALLEKLTSMGYTTPTPVQMQAIPPALEGKDILGSAQTGTGKTAAFGIPMMVRLMNNPRGSALILTPTRELATQVMTVLKQMQGKYNPIQTALLIGGESMGPQFIQLKNRPRIIIGTPGRVFDHLERRGRGQSLHHTLHQGRLRQRIARPLQKEHRDLDRRQMIGASHRPLFGCVQRKSKKAQTTHVG